MTKMRTEQCDSLEINGCKYVRADLAADLTKPAMDPDGRPFVIIRSDRAGVFAGYLTERNDQTRVVKLDGCIRLHRWTGCSLSQVACDGVAGTGENRFAMPTNAHEILQVIEIIPCTEKARVAIQGVPTWKM